MTKLDIKVSMNRSMTKSKEDLNSEAHSCHPKIIIYRKDKKIKTSFTIWYPQPDLSDILLSIRIILQDIDDSFEQYCKHEYIDPDEPSSKKKFRERIKVAKQLDRMFNGKELNCLPTTSSVNDDLKEKIIELDSTFEYNRLTELLDTVQYYDKLLSQYGYDAKKDEWNLRNFPITQNDKQMDGIKTDIQKFGNAADEYNEYFEYLQEKYGKSLDEIHGCIFLPPTFEKVIGKEY
jgi:hypothetical protein